MTEIFIPSGKIFCKVLVHISGNIKLIKAPPASAGQSNAPVDSDEGLSLGSQYEIAVWKVGDPGECTVLFFSWTYIINKVKSLVVIFS